MATYRTRKSVILYDADSVCDADSAPQIGPTLISPDAWRQRGLVVGDAAGRGASLFLDAGEEQWVLRPYRRGGMIARLSERRYVWTGWERTRAIREFRLTADLHAQGLPVPRPVAAGVTRYGLTYEAALITVRIPGAHALADLLIADEADDELLHRVGATIRRFHDAGLDHVDLNARNLLVDREGKVWMIDFDRCRLQPPGDWQQANLERLHRSLVKFSNTHAIHAIDQGYAR
ncbi:3-deoxy-D-manno-octulosonic acid kinase [Billgrantia gudaonensis]|uniref:3-deoxy-D-manno-octulosonic acid kinase n=1 Tax=Billgrantia gudaonensis TaxID=376427 RepID=A0A1G8PK65_9GAMM|nr:3-deoxy-D-manno-octulosonic acid kinase [Halomonas gudaonensis]